MNDLRRRAAERLPGLLNLPEFKLGETLAPIRIVAKALAGTSPLFWAADLFRVRNISIPVSHASDGHIAFQSEGGIMLINLSGVASYAFYVEAVIRTPTAQTLMHWDTAMGGDPVHGTMTRAHPGGDLHYFATPFAVEPETSVIQVSQQSPVAGPDEHWTLAEVVLLGFRHD